MYRFESLSLRQERLNISKMHRNVRLTRPDVFLSGPAHATAAPASVPGVPTVPIVSTVSGRTDREERREMPRIGPFVWERPIAESSVFCNLRRFYRFAAKIHAQSQAGGLSFAGFRNTLFP